jgi:hypothetical protein
VKDPWKLSAIQELVEFADKRKTRLTPKQIRMLKRAGIISTVPMGAAGIYGLTKLAFTHKLQGKGADQQ